MDIDKAKEIIKNTDFLSSDDTPKCSLLAGMSMIAFYTKISYIDSAAEHDQFYYGNFDETVELMDEIEVTYLASLGWFEEHDSWSHFL